MIWLYALRDAIPDSNLTNYMSDPPGQSNQKSQQPQRRMLPSESMWSPILKDVKYIITTFLMVVGIGVTIWFGIASRDGRSPEIRMIRQTDIAPFGLSSLLLDVDITAIYDPRISAWDDRPVEPIQMDRIRLASVEFVNVGDAAFEWSEYDSPFRIWVTGAHNRILDVRRFGRSLPSRLEIARDWRSFEVSTMFMNPKESLRFEIVYIGDKDSLKGRARLRDHPAITLEERDTSDAAPKLQRIAQQQRAKTRLNSLFLPVVAGLVLAFIFVGRATDRPREYAKTVLLWAASAFLGAWFAYGTAWLCIQFNLAFATAEQLFVVIAIGVVPGMRLIVSAAWNRWPSKGVVRSTR